MDDVKRNPMKLEDVKADTPWEIDFVYKRNGWYRASESGHRPTVAYVVALKPCGCTGPSLGHVETVQLPKTERPLDRFKAPRAWNPKTSGYKLRLETKDRVGLYLNGERLFGQRWHGGAEPWDLRTQKQFEYAYKRLAWDHHYRTVREANRPMKPDGFMHATLKEAMERRPRAACKLWAVYPDKPYRYDRKSKPVGYVWGQDAAAKALFEWWVKKNAARDHTYVAVPEAA